MDAALTLTRTAVRELAERYGTSVSPAQLQHYLDLAAHDLRGSLATAESLPELAIRLAMVRLEAAGILHTPPAA